MLELQLSLICAVAPVATSVLDGATRHQQGGLKWKKRDLNFHYSISILSDSESNLIDEPPRCPCVTRAKLMVLHWMAEPVFPMNKLLAGGGLLILCSFLRLIIHSTGSSCYRCPALHPRSSHWGLTLKKKKKKKTLLMVICTGGKEEALWPLHALQPRPFAPNTTWCNAKDSDVKIQTGKCGG